MTDLEKAIRIRQEAAITTLKNHPDRAGFLNNLRNCFNKKYSRTGAMTDLEKAIRMRQEAVTTTPKNHPDRAGFLYNLGNHFSDRC